MADWAALKAKRARRPPPTPPVIPSHLAPSVSPPAPTPEHDQSDHSAACGCGSAPPPPDASVREENAYADLPPSLEVRRVEGRGRGVFAKRGLKAGSTLLATAPLVSVLDNYNLGRRCGYCFTKKLGGGGTGELLQCSACKVVRYCSSACQSLDWKGPHKDECKALIGAAKAGGVPDTPVRALGRLVWLRAKDAGGNLSKEMDSLQSHRDSLSQAQQEQYFQLSVSLAAYVGQATLSSAGLASASTMLDLCSRFASNSFSLTSPTLSNIGAAISPLIALLNHSCAPNAVVVFPSPPSPTSPSPASRKNMKVIALRDLLAGEEILTSYVDLALRGEDRRAELKERYGFECVCDKCRRVGLDAREALVCEGCGELLGIPRGDVEADAVLDCSKCGRRRSIHVVALQDAIAANAKVLKEAEGFQYTNPNRAMSLLTPAITSLTSLSLAPSSYPLLSLHQTIFPLLLSTPQTALLLSLSTSISRGLTLLHPLTPHPTKAIALAAEARLRVALLHPEDEGLFWKDRESVRGCLVGLRKALEEVRGSLGRGVVEREVEDLVGTLEDGLGRMGGL